MRQAGLTISGSIGDRLVGVAGLVKGCADLRGLEYRWPRIVQVLEDVAERVSMVRRRGGRPAGIDSGLAWIEQVAREHAGFDEPGGEGLRDELLRLAHRVRHAR